MITVPGGSEFFVKPRRSSAFGALASIIHSSVFPLFGSFTSMWIQGWGLIHSILVTVPVSFNGLLASNSAENEWWAEIVVPTTSSPTPVSATNCLRIKRYLLLFLVTRGIGLLLASVPFITEYPKCMLLRPLCQGNDL